MYSSESNLLQNSMDLGSNLVTHEIHTNPVRKNFVGRGVVFQVAGEFCLLLYISSIGFPDGVCVKYADNTLRITCYQYNNL